MDSFVIPEPLLEMFTALAREAEARNLSLYVVGGFVRDLLLGQASMDIDLVVEGDAIRFARLLAERYGGSIQAYEPFGTATWTLAASTPGLPAVVDVATARTEAYPEPAMLPVVAPGTIQQDLFRRDFTINAMAVRLAPSPFGELLDLYHGQSDLSAGIIRVLHDRSLVDDPTRMFRAVRFEQRFRFSLHPDTEALFASALPAVDLLSGERLRHEFDMLFQEAEPERALLRLDQLGVLSYAALRADEDLARTFAAARELVSREPSQSGWRLTGAKLDLVYWGLLCCRVSSLPRLARRLALSKPVQVVIEQTQRADRASLALSAATHPSEIDVLLDGMTPEALAAIWAQSHSDAVRDKIAAFARTWRHVRPLLDGNVVQQMGLQGKQIGDALRVLRAARLDGKVESADDERDIIRKMV